MKGEGKQKRRKQTKREVQQKTPEKKNFHESCWNQQSQVKKIRIQMNQFIHPCFNLFLVFSFQSIFLGEGEIGFVPLFKLN